jgi:hypothetical protein
MIVSTTDSPAGIAKALSVAWEQFIEAEERRDEQKEPQKNVWASQYHPCTRHLYNNLTHSHELPPFPAEVKARFRRGNDRERDIRQDLDRIGRLCDPPFSVVKQQERFALEVAGRVVITGKVDGRLHFGKGLSEPPFEVKAWSPTLVQGVKRFEDLLENKWTRAGCYQMLSYLYGSGSEYGLLIIDRSGIPQLLLAELTDENYLRLDEFLGKSDQAMRYKESGTIPDFTVERTLCPSCKWFGSFCQPPTLAGSGASIFAGPEFDEIEAQIKRHEELKPFAKEYDTLHEDLSKQFRGVEQGILGHYLIDGKWSAFTKYNVPANIKEQYKQVDPKGKFSVKFVPIGGEPKTE